MLNRKVLFSVGAVIGAVGLVGVALLIKRFRSVKAVAETEERLIDEVMKVALKSTRKVKQKKRSVLVKRKISSASKLLKLMKKGTEYTQIALVKVSALPYRSIRRYVELLVEEGKIVASGYGKGKKFAKV